MLRQIVSRLAQTATRNVTINSTKTSSRLVASRSLYDLGVGSEGLGDQMEIAKGEKITEFQKAKLIHKFNLYDIDGDREIEHEDFDNYIDKLGEVYGLPADDPLLHAFKEEFEAHWHRMLQFMDENKDGVLSVDEWVSLYPRVTRNLRGKSYDHMPRFLQTMADGMFKLMDGKGDGLVDAEEYRDFFGKMFPPPMPIEEAKKHVNHMTENGKYKLTLERYREVHADYTYSPSADTCGRYAMGPFEFEGK